MDSKGWKGLWDVGSILAVIGTGGHAGGEEVDARLLARLPLPPHVQDGVGALTDKDHLCCMPVVETIRLKRLKAAMNNKLVTKDE
eukprot:5455545-Pyramimonas_sp.AAC.1